ncbi:hypothetical protein GCM10009077_44660 [Roseibium denhamense]
MWGSAVTGQWADAAETYQKLAASLQSQWSEAVAGGFGVTAAALLIATNWVVYVAAVTSGLPTSPRSARWSPGRSAGARSTVTTA